MHVWTALTSMLAGGMVLSSIPHVDFPITSSQACRWPDPLPIEYQHAWRQKPYFSVWFLTSETFSPGSRLRGYTKSYRSWLTEHRLR